MRTMKTTLCVLTILLAAALAPAQTNSLTALLQQGLIEEQANRNLDAAIADYQSLAAQFDKDRQLAATAVFRLGECYRAQGKTNEAAAQYQRIVHDFSDQTTLAMMSRENLTGLGAAAPQPAASENPEANLWNSVKNLSRADVEKALPTLAPDAVLTSLLQQRNEAENKLAGLAANFTTNNAVMVSQENVLERINKQISDRIDGILMALKLRAEAAGPALPDAARQRQQQFLEEEIKVVEQEVHTQEAQFKAGVLPKEGSWAAEQKLLELKQQLAALEAGQAISPQAIAPTSDEENEIQHIRQMIQNSPDLINAGENPPLVSAAASDHLRVAQYLLDANANVNVRNAGKETPLIAAASQGHKAMVELLLNHGADINAKSGRGQTALYNVADKGFEAVADVLLARKADVNLADNHGFTPLCVAAPKSRAKIIQMLLAAGANPNLKSTGDDTALMRAADGDSEIVKALLAAGADPNAKSKGGEAPLMLAVQRGSPETVKALLAAGAEPNTEDKQGMMPLSHAIESGSLESVKLLLAAKADPNGGKLDAPLICAIHKQDTALAELLLNAGADPNAPGAVSDGWRGPDNDMNFFNNRSHITPLWLATYWNELPMVTLLLKFKADPNDEQTDGWPLLFRAVDHPDILEALLDAGAKVDPRDPTGNSKRTALGAATGWNHVAAVDILLKHGADPNAREGNGATALHTAAYRVNFSPPEDRKIFELLLNHHADPNAQGDNGDTPFSILNRAGDSKTVLDIADLMRQHGALENPPHWDRIEVNRLSGQSPAAVFRKNDNEWNRFTLLETIANYYVAGYNHSRRIPPFQPGGYQPPVDVLTPYQPNGMPFPDLTRVVIVRPSQGSTNQTRMTVNLLNSTNGIDCSKDVPLEFGDMVEIAVRDHSLGDAPVKLTDSQCDTILNYLKGKVQLVVRDQKAELPLDPVGEASVLRNVLNQQDAQKLILSSSDLSRVKVSRHDPKTGEKRECIVDCTKSGGNEQPGAALPMGPPPPRPAGIPMQGIPAPRRVPAIDSYLPGQPVGNPSMASTDLRLRDGDVIEVPDKP